MKEISNEEILKWSNLVKLVMKKHYYANDILEEEDLYNIGLTGVWKALCTYDENLESKHGSAKLKNYIFRVVFNEIGVAVGRINSKGKDEMRSVTFSMDLKIDDEESDTFHEITQYPNKVIEDQDDIFVSEEIKTLMAFLTEEEKEIVIHKINGYTIREIAEIMDSNRTTVNNRYRRALEKMCFKSEHRSYTDVCA